VNSIFVKFEDTAFKTFNVSEGLRISYSSNIDVIRKSIVNKDFTKIFTYLKLLNFFIG